MEFTISDHVGSTGKAANVCTVYLITESEDVMRACKAPWRPQSRSETRCTANLPNLKAHSAPNLQITLPLQAHECLANTFKRSTHDGRLYVPHPAEFSTHTKVSKQGNQNVCVQQASNIHPEPPDPGSISSCKIEKALKKRKGKERTSSRCFQKLESTHKKYE